ncbi:WD40 repeat isoform A [Micractinium conductrix]|nr:WD40 repeat isoform A [Micractinium conductrix]|eukprot:PSC72481.1 WD40 repeat isoform A [Micractinium conductrix]
MEAFLASRASADAPGATRTVLPTTPFADADGQHYVQLDAAVVAGDTVYVGELKTVLGEAAVEDVVMKLVKIRGAVQRGRSPDLAAALQGVTHVKLFLGGDAVRQGLAVQELAEAAAVVGASLVLPSGQALGLASEPAPAVRL